MKVICLKEHLRNNLSLVERVTGKNPTLSILQNVLLKTDKGRLQISATNLEFAVHTVVAGKVEKDGSATIPARTLLNFVSAVPEEKITLEEKNTNLSIRAGRYHAECRGLDPKDFPIIPKVEEGFSAHLDCQVFGKALQSLVGLTATAEARPELSGIYLAFSGGEARCAATDSFRLGEFTLASEKPSSQELSEYILPSRAALELVRLLGDGEREAVFVAGGNQVAIRAGEKEFISRLIEGKYPNYRAIVPTSFSTTMVFEKEELVQAIRAAGIFTGKLQDIKLTLKTEKKSLLLESRDSEVGEEQIELSGEGEGKEVAISFNYRYLLDAVLSTESEKVSLQCNKETDPVLVRGAGNQKSLFLVMPLRSF